MGENGVVRAYLLVSLGAIVGASVRWAVGEAVGSSLGEFPWATLLVNLAGCLLAGLAVRTLAPGSDRWLAAVTGLLGGLTTYSAFAVETRALLDAGHPGQALAYVAVSVVGGMAAIEATRDGWSRR